jgi:hypothetical protein
MSTSLHSPLPWHHFEHCEGHSINDADGHHVAYTDWYSDAFDTVDAPADHNAEFIVRACNAHLALVDAARHCQRLCRLIERWADAEDSVDCAELMAEIVDLAQGDRTGLDALELAGCPIIEAPADPGKEVHS